VLRSLDPVYHPTTVSGALEFIVVAFSAAAALWTVRKSGTRFQDVSKEFRIERNCRNDSKMLVVRVKDL
jgi:hypothetical protein